MAYPSPPSEFDPVLARYLNQLISSLNYRDGQSFFGPANKGGASSWVLTSVSVNRSYNPNTATSVVTANVLATLLQDLKNKGIIA